MKVYTVVVIFHPMNAPQNYKVTCKSFPYYTQAAEYKKEKENDFLLVGEGIITMLNCLNKNCSKVHWSNG